MEELHTAIRDVPKPVIARVQGYAIGGGNVLATICDLTICSEKAIFGLGSMPICYAESDEALAMLLAQGEEWGFQIAVAHACRGESDEAFKWLERAYELRDSGIPATKMLPMLASLHSDPRWPRFLEKIGMTP